jgi:Glycosyltransferase family 87
MIRRRRLFALTIHQWLNLASACSGLLFALFLAWSVVSRGLFEYVGIDFRTLRASAQIAADVGFGAVYDLAVQEPYQRELYEAFSHGPLRMAFATVPMPYLPAFVLLLEPLLLFSPMVGFVVLSAASLIGGGLYLRRFRARIGIVSPWPGTAALLLSLPMLLTVMVGQVNVLLLVSLGEGLLAFRAGRRLKAGFFLGGLLLKPQTLILFLPILFLSGEWTTLAGFGLAALGVLGLSLALAGPSGLGAMIQLLLAYPRGMPTTFPESMVNWRALGIQTSGVLGSTVATILVGIGSVATLALLYRLFHRLRRKGPEGAASATAGTYAGTCSITWHSHVHMALPLMPLVPYLSDQGILPVRACAAYLLAPTIGFSLIGITVGSGAAHNFAGLSTLVLHLWLLESLGRARPDSVREPGHP